MKETLQDHIEAMYRRKTMMCYGDLLTRPDQAEIAAAYIIRDGGKNDEYLWDVFNDSSENIMKDIYKMIPDLVLQVGEEREAAVRQVIKLIVDHAVTNSEDIIEKIFESARVSQNDEKYFCNERVG